MPALTDPHHDGSPLYLSDEAPELGDVVTVRVRTHTRDPAGRIDQIWIRTTYDAEPIFHACMLAESSPDTEWWNGELPVHNPVTHYRFLIQQGDRQRWLTAAGLREYDGPDTFDFKVSASAAAPEWGRDGVVYQIFPDRFARSDRADQRELPAWAQAADWHDPVIWEPDDPRTPSQFYGGDLDGIIEHLDHLESLGVDTVYLTPVFPAASNHRYNSSTFSEIDPMLGGDAAYARLATAIHARGMRLLGDLTTNHTGSTHEWFVSAREDGWTRDWYYFGVDGGYESWMGFDSLPKLNHANQALREAMVEGPESVVAHWLRPPYNVDGWRIDVANMTGRLGSFDVCHEIARTVRSTAEAERADALVIAEHNHDASDDLPGDGWHGTMNYSGFSWPIWSWLRDPQTRAKPFGRPVSVPRRPGPAIFESLREWHARFGWRPVTSSWNILGSHDSARIRTVVTDPRVHRLAAGLQFTLPGIPMIFAGDEFGLEGVNGEDARRPMPWGETGETSTMATYAALSQLRRKHAALRRGSLRWAYVDDDALVFVREHPDGAVLVAARRAAGPAIAIPGLNATNGEQLFTSEGTQSALADAQIPAVDGPELAIWAI